MSGTIYTIRHIPSGRCYVGSSHNVKRRWENHRTDLRTGRHHNKSLQQAFAADGMGALEFSVVAPDTIETRGVLERERHLIAELTNVFNAAKPQRRLGRHIKEKRAKVRKVPSRTRKTQIVAVRLQPELREVLRRASKAHGLPQSTFLYKLATDWAKAHGWLKETKP